MARHLMRRPLAKCSRHRLVNLQRIGLDMRRNYPAWTAVSMRLAGRPAVQRTLLRGGVSIEDV